MMDKALSPLFIAGPTLSNRLHMASKKDHRVSQSFTSLQWRCRLSSVRTYYMTLHKYSIYYTLLHYTPITSPETLHL